MASEEFTRAFQATTPDDTLDPPRFSQGIELAKDVLVLELRAFFASAAQSTGRLSELPTIEKYNTFGAGMDPYETVVQIVRKFPGVAEALPHIAVMSTEGKQLPLSIGTPLLAAVQEAPRITATLAGPYDLSYPGSSPAADGQSLVLRTRPGGKKGPYITSTLTFLAGRFTDITAATTDEVVAAINEQALYVEAFAVTVGMGTGVEIRTGGPYGRARPNELEVMLASSPSIVTALGFGRAGSGDSIGGTAPDFVLTDSAGAFVAGEVGRNLTLVSAAGDANAYFNNGLFPITARTGTTATYTNKYGRTGAFAGTWFIGARDDTTNTLRPPMNRYVYSWDLDCAVEIIAEDENTRTELVDLVGSFFSFWLEQKLFTFLGRASMGVSGAPAGEHFQMVLRSDVRARGEQEVARPEDAKDKLYINGFSFSTHVTMYIDREVRVLSGPSTGRGWTVEGSDFTEDETLPTPS